MSVDTIENFLTSEDIQWFCDDFARRLAGPLPEQKTSVVKQYQIELGETGHARILDCIQRSLPDIADKIDVVMSYQRQYSCLLYTSPSPRD